MLRRAWLKKIIILFLASLFGLFLSNFKAVSQEGNLILPELKTHPFPTGFKITEDQGDYFSQIQTTSVGYLVWSDFPVKVYLDLPQTTANDDSAEARRLKIWLTQASIAITDWSQYLPLLIVHREEDADIIIKREAPPLGGQINPQTGLREGLRARSGQTTYQVYLSRSERPTLLHRMTIRIYPGLRTDALLACLKHELGHALGIWGHSPLPSDLLYAAQSQSAQSISLRDLNTLKIIYQQPTRLGWTVSYSSSQDSTRINSLTGSCREKPKSNNSCFQ